MNSAEKNEMNITVISSNAPVTVVNALTDGELFTYNVSQNDETVLISLIDVSEMSSHGVVIFYKQLNVFEIMLPVNHNTAPHSQYGIFDKITTASSSYVVNNQLATTVLSRQFYLPNDEKTANVTVDSLIISATKTEIIILEQSFNFPVNI